MTSKISRIPASAVGSTNRRFSRALAAAPAIVAAIFFGFPAHAGAGEAAVQLRFEKHRFAPQTVTVPAAQALVLNVVNASDETIEFESFALHREKVVEPGRAISVRVPALGTGAYDFYDDLHQDVPEGRIVVK